MKELVVEVQFLIRYIGGVFTLRPNLSEEVIGPVHWNVFGMLFFLNI